MFYGIIQEEYVYEDCLLEINLKDAISTIKNKIKNAILGLIDKIEGLLNKGKDNKLKQALRSLLNKVKSLLTKSEKIETKGEAQELTQEVNDAKKELDNIERTYTDTLTTGEFKEWFKDNITSDDQAGLIIYRPNKKVDNTSKNTFKLISQFRVDKQEIHLIVADSEGNIIARRDIMFGDMSETTQRFILNNIGINKSGCIVIEK